MKVFEKRISRKKLNPNKKEEMGYMFGYFGKQNYNGID